MKKIRFVIFLAWILNLLPTTVAIAQEEGLHLGMSRDWGYSSGTGDIQGLFSMKVTGSSTLARVEFYIDDTKIGEKSLPPFTVQFNTDDYPIGLHTLYAVGYSTGESEMRTQEVRVNFVSADQSGKSALKIILPMGVILFAAIILAVLVPLLLTKGKVEQLPLGEERKYGIKGGGICPHCHRPFIMHLWGLNLGLSRFDRCPYCGKWSVLRSQSLAKLRQAEKAELEWGYAGVKEESEEEKLRKSLDDSKYQGL
jgi:hypothetical protein